MREISVPVGTATAIDLIAFYNPQFQSYDAGATASLDNWMKVRGGRQNFVGHVSPIEPDELGYYDLRDRSTLEAQFALARAYGIRGFCCPVYWSSAGQQTSDALGAMLADFKTEMPFCICWVNGNDEHDDGQAIFNTAGEDSRAFIHAILKYIKDVRYLRVGQQPILLVRHPHMLPNAFELTRYWKAVVQDAGCGELHVCAVEENHMDDSAVLGFDAVVEMPPRRPLPPLRAASTEPKLLNPNFRGRTFEYRALRDWHLAQPFCRTYRYYRAVTPRWDTTASSQDESEIALGSTPSEYQEWLYWAGLQTLLAHPPGRRLLFVNSWNDWTNGSILEPDRRYRREYLEATHNALRDLNERVAVFDDYWSGLAQMEKVSETSANGFKAIVMNYERSLAALRGMAPQKRELSCQECFDSLPLQRLTEIYLRRMHQALERPQVNVTDIFRAVPIRPLTKAYLRRLALAVSRRVRTMTSRLR